MLAGAVATTLSNPAWTFTNTGGSQLANLIPTVSGSTFAATAPLISGGNSFTITATASANGVSQSATTASIVAYPPLAMTREPYGTVAGTVGMTLATSTPTASNVLGTASYSLQQNGSPANIGTICPGLTLSAATGTISGIPTATCAASGFTLVLADSFDGTTAASTAFGFNITTGGLVISGTPPTGVGLGPYYWNGVSVSGGTAPYGNFFVENVGGTTFSAMGLSIDQNTGTISANVLANNATWSGLIGVVDASGKIATAPVTITSSNNTLSFACSGSCPGTSGLSGAVNTAWTNLANLTVSGGTAPYTWSLAPGADFTTSGLTFTSNGATAAAGGTPTAVGIYSFKIQVTDSAGRVAYFPLPDYSPKLYVYSTTRPQIAIGAPPYVHTLDVGKSFAGSIVASIIGGSGAPNTAGWALVTTSGSLPAGITFTSGSNGTFAGTPTAAGSWTGYVTGKDTNGNTAQSLPISITVNPAPTLSGTPPSGMVGLPYSFVPTVSGGSPGYSGFSYTLVSGSSLATLGLAIDANTGIISGTPTTAGTATGKITFSDGQSATGHTLSSSVTSANFTITVAAGLAVSQTAQNFTLTNGAAVTPFTATTFSGGVGPYTATIYNGPAGIAATAAGGVVTISGTPVGAGTSNVFNAFVKVTDATGLPASSNTITLTLTTTSFASGSGPYPTSCYTGSAFPGSPGTGMTPIACSGGTTASNVAIGSAGTAYVELDTTLPIKTGAAGTLGAQSFACAGCSNNGLTVRGWYWQPLAQAWAPLNSGNAGTSGSGTVPDANIYAQKFLFRATAGGAVTNALYPN